MPDVQEAIRALPYVFYVAGAACIIVDGPLPFGDAFGVSLIAYGRGLQYSLKAADGAIWLNNQLTPDKKTVNITQEGYWTGPGIRYYYAL